MQMATRSLVRWFLTGAVFMFTAAFVFLPALFLLAATPLHDGDDLPGPLLLFCTIAVACLIGSAAGWLVFRLLRSWTLQP